MKRQKTPALKMTPGVFYIWVGGSCDYAHPERAGGGAYLIRNSNGMSETYAEARFGTTEFRMMLTVMIHAMERLPEGSDIIFLTNVAYLQNFDRLPPEGSVNADLIKACSCIKSRHRSVSVHIISYHKYEEMTQTHEIAHRAMNELRSR